MWCIEFYVKNAMKKKKEPKQQFKTPQLSVMVGAICQEYKLEPSIVVPFLFEHFPELKDKSKCSNCGASMALYEHSIDSIDALLLLGMGKIVSERAKKMPFTEANAVHVQSQLNTYYSVSSRTSWCSKLGLIAKIKRKDGTHDQKAGWCITKRGFEFLAGKPVPSKVVTFRNGIVERFEETITFGDIATKSNDFTRSRELSTHKEHNFNKLETWAVVGFAQGVLL